MKKLFVILVSVFAIMLTMPACEEDIGDGCKNCRITVTDSDGNIVSVDENVELCGEELEELEGQEINIGGDRTSKCECD